MRQPAYILFTLFVSVGIASLVSFFVVSEARSATYSQVVDNTTAGRFKASSKWITSNYEKTEMYGRNYRALKRPSSSARSARWRIKVPSGGKYTVFARWPANSGYTGRATYRVNTVNGWKTKTVSQKTGGGRWFKLGAFSLAAGDDWKIALASTTSSKGYIVADAVRIVRGTTSSTTESGSTATGAAVVAEARKHIGKPYVYGAAGPNSFDCSGFTQYVYKQFGKSLPHSASQQYGYGRSVSGSQLQAGDLIFGNAGGSGIQHVGIYDGNGKMIHAGTPETDVEATPFPNSWYNVVGYRRIL